jgi:hypothetical protein
LERAKNAKNVGDLSDDNASIPRVAGTGWLVNIVARGNRGFEWPTTVLHQ